MLGERASPHPRKWGHLALERPADPSLVTEAQGRCSSARGRTKFGLKLTLPSPSVPLRPPSGSPAGERRTSEETRNTRTAGLRGASSGKFPGRRARGGERSRAKPRRLSASLCWPYPELPEGPASPGQAASWVLRGGQPPSQSFFKKEETRGHMGHPPASAPGPAVPRGPAAGPL